MAREYPSPASTASGSALASPAGVRRTGAHVGLGRCSSPTARTGGRYAPGIIRPAGQTGATAVPGTKTRLADSHPAFFKNAGTQDQPTPCDINITRCATLVREPNVYRCRSKRQFHLGDRRPRSDPETLPAGTATYPAPPPAWAFGPRRQRRGPNVRLTRDPLWLQVSPAAA